MEPDLHLCCYFLLFVSGSRALKFGRLPLHSTSMKGYYYRRHTALLPKGATQPIFKNGYEAHI